jgi:hypothetical protein
VFFARKKKRKRAVPQFCHTGKGLWFHEAKEGFARADWIIGGTLRFCSKHVTP